jgi:MFS family permease
MPTKGALMRRRNISIILANVLDHFDANLYGFMAPIMAPLFFPKQEPIIQLILAYSLLATSSITRPIGVLIFGGLATHCDPWKILRVTLMGVGVATFMMGCIPTFTSASYYSALILLFVRIIGDIFAAGEKTIASLYILEDKTNKQAIMANAWFCTSVMLGCAMASWAASTVSEHTWRIPFWCGGLLALYVVFLRYSAQPAVLSSSVSGSRHASADVADALSKDDSRVRSVLIVIFGGGLGHVTYDLSFVLMNTYVPLITTISRQTIMEWNTMFLLFDLASCVPIGAMIWHYDAGKIKRLSALMLSIPAIPLFYFMENASLPYVLFVRAWIVVWGVVFSCVLTVGWLRLFTYKSKYLWIGLCSAAGTSLIGRSTSALCLWGWHKTHWAAVPGIYLGGVATIVWLLSRKKDI